MTSRVGRSLAVDVGEARVGLALSDPDGLLATPLETVRRDRDGLTDVIRIAALVEEHDVRTVVVGLPRTLAGRVGPAAEAAQHYAQVLGPRVEPVPVVFADERLTTVVATRTLSDRGVRGRKQRAVIDQAAAVGILQSWLDARRGDEARRRMEDNR